MESSRYKSRWSQAEELPFIQVVIDREVSLFGSVSGIGAVKATVCKRKAWEEVANVLNRMMLRVMCAATILILCLNSCEGIHIVPPVLGYGGETTNVTCLSTDIIPGNHYTWLKDSVTIFQSSHEGRVKKGKYNGLTQRGQITLQVLNTTLADAGNYTCSFNYEFVHGTVSVAYKPESVTYQASRANGLALTLSVVRVYPNDSSINIVRCARQNYSTTEMFSARQSCSSNIDEPYLFDIVWIGTTTKTSLTGDYVCTVNLTVIRPYVTSVNVTFPAAATTEGSKKDELKWWLFIQIAAVLYVAFSIGIIGDSIYKKLTGNKAKPADHNVTNVELAPMIPDIPDAIWDSNSEEERKSKAADKTR